MLFLCTVEESSEFLPAVDIAPVLIDEELEKRSYEGLKTCLLPAPHTAHLTYTRRPWSLALRKEVRDSGIKPFVMPYSAILHCITCCTTPVSPLKSKV